MVRITANAQGRAVAVASQEALGEIIAVSFFTSTGFHLPGYLTNIYIYSQTAFATDNVTSASTVETSDIVILKCNYYNSMLRIKVRGVVS